jgi:hypothetical protein
MRLLWWIRAAMIKHAKWLKKQGQKFMCKHIWAMESKKMLDCNMQQTGGFSVWMPMND